MSLAPTSAFRLKYGEIVGRAPVSYKFFLMSLRVLQMAKSSFLILAAVPAGKLFTCCSK